MVDEYQIGFNQWIHKRKKNIQCYLLTFTLGGVNSSELLRSTACKVIHFTGELQMLTLEEKIYVGTFSNHSSQ